MKRRSSLLLITGLAILVALALLWGWWLSRRGPARSPAAPVASPASDPEVPPSRGGGHAKLPEASAEEPGEPLAAEALKPTPPALAVLSGFVLDSKGERLERGIVLSEDCRIFAVVREGFFSRTVAPGSCTVQARRRDGLLYARSEPLRVELRADRETEVELVVPAERTGGLGVGIVEHEEGIVVTDVYPGTPAEDMELMPGDLIIEVDGLPTAALELDEFIEVMTGPEGSDVEFVLSYGGDTGSHEERLTLTRAPLDASMAGGVGGPLVKQFRIDEARSLMEAVRGWTEGAGRD